MAKKYIRTVLCVLFVATVFCGCTGSATSNAASSESVSESTVEPVVETIKVPDISEAAESDGRNVLSSMGLIPVVEETDSDDVEKGIIISTSPSAGSEVEPNSKVKVYVSSGPSIAKSKSSYAEWYSIGSVKDQWKWNNPYIKDDYMYIKCKVTFGTAQHWYTAPDKEIGGGVAAINDSYTKSVPIEIDYKEGENSWNAGDERVFTIKIPLSDLGTDKPTDLYCRLALGEGNVSESINISFSMTW